ncbi:flavin reductase family protein [Amycolatopsis alkalitolerans]|uniref:Flavin reductase family protein n=1 Tax=Amycolatopsis alkalitolerans TaxID=2547244 RepID=A0A5C4M2V1_9PSEU|nr:flavin reductase family protein [Amycolatopsis alkalitolerans]TNC26510.1 flavin reductase family protein [Amycolatopsis alkalitolerans]
MGLHPVEAGPGAFKAALGSLAASVTVITLSGAGRPLGMTATAFSSVSLDPLLILVCVNRSTRSYEHIAAAGRFGVNILGSAAREISDHCARPGADKALRPEWLAPEDGWRSPALAGALAFLDCAIERDVHAGTHAVLIGAVDGIGLGATHEPLLHFRGTYRQLRARNHHPRPRPLPITLEEPA